jgi:hypothetical protein
MQFVPIPTTPEHIQASLQHWFPFLPGIARRSKEPITNLLGQIDRREIQLALAWDEEKLQACALFGLCFTRRGNDLIGEVRWLTGKDMKRWLGLLPDLEQYFRDMGCVVIRPICRPGWSRMIRGEGYRITHYTMEKVL